MSIPESKSVTRGTLWLVLVACGVLIAALARVSTSGIEAWAKTVEDRGIENQRRITALERQYAAIEEQLKASADRQTDMLELLREHMRASK